MTFINVDLAVHAGESRWAGAGVGADKIVTGPAVLTWIPGTFVDVDLAAGAGEPARAVALEGARRVDAEAVVLAGRSRLALVDILRAVDPFESFGAGAHVGSCNKKNQSHEGGDALVMLHPS